MEEDKMVLRKPQTGSSPDQEDLFHDWMGKIQVGSIATEQKKLGESQARLKLQGITVSKSVRDMANRHPADFLALRKHILDMAWAMAQTGLQVNFTMSDSTIAKRVLQTSGGWQALMGLYFMLDPKQLNASVA